MPKLPIEEDITFLKKTIADLAEQVELLTSLQDMSIQIISGFDFEKIIHIFLDLVSDIARYNSCVLYLYNDDRVTYRPVASRGVSLEDLDAYDLDKDIIQWALDSRRWTPILPARKTADKADSFSILPLHGVKNSIGFLLMSSTEEANLFTQTNSNQLIFLARQTGIAIENQDLYARLNQSKDYIQNILESISNGIMTIDMSDRVSLINMNATAILGLSSVDVIGHSYHDILPKGLLAITERLKNEALAKGFAFDTLFDFYPTPTLNIPLGVNSSVLVAPSGERIGVIFVFMDMSALKEIERLRHVDELKSEFVSNVSHELRTPLSIIKSYVEALLQQVDPEDHDTRRQFLTIVEDETDRLSGLVGDLLDISRIESGKFEMDLRPINLADIVRQVAKDFENRSNLHDIIIDVPPTLPPIVADEDKMVQVFFNLIDNAIKFSPAGGEILVAARAGQSSIHCDISDPGLGIDEKEISRIFEKFYRIDNSDCYEIPGTGLGLPIVQYIVDAHHGKISVTSQKGQGTTFSVRFPLRLPEALKK
ncbi:MAG: PAS domain-containing protein [Deltaproteobacteria bacterium]|nr:PAS domain-containing protein [Deltaproteobacteria bacterium]